MKHKQTKFACAFLNNSQVVYYSSTSNSNDNDNMTFNLIENQKYWVAGFIEGEGSTNISFKKQKNMKIGLRPCPSFSVTQHSKRVSSLNLVKTLLNDIGRIYPKPGRPEIMVFEVTNLKHLNNIVIPFLETYNCFSARKSELIIFKQIVEKMCDKMHLNSQGLTEIINLLHNSSINTKNRKHSKDSLFSLLENNKNVID